jgi:hypothetical protein
LLRSTGKSHRSTVLYRIGRGVLERLTRCASSMTYVCCLVGKGYSRLITIQKHLIPFSLSAHLASLYRTTWLLWCVRFFDTCFSRNFNFPYFDTRQDAVFSSEGGGGQPYGTARDDEEPMAACKTVDIG